MWHTIHMSNNETSRYSDENLVKICCYAVERSCGQLEDIQIVSFCIDDLLQYIARCGRQLRSIQLTKCHRFSEVANQFPMLEELDISLSNLCKDSIEVIGRSCPHLKSLKFSQMFCNFFEFNDDAFAIAKTMPMLRHLSMSGNSLSNIGLDAILDGCPLLESLDLRRCFHLNLIGSLEKRCRDQIKDLVLPTDIYENSDDIDENSDDEDKHFFYLGSLMDQVDFDFFMNDFHDLLYFNDVAFD
ncbi:putative F-box/LRR-repeat protein 23 [Trifolium pratense]|uniref:putative F-box/LRR-repeat protein 23 n=1 Tax=Trifolium pratense TaxID=57577 RepID=UPI001E69493C|nr:putative F-box/LRR-repeat protein 23 [Trifolium pratense]